MTVAPARTHQHLDQVLASASSAAKSLLIPTRMIDLHREVPRSERQAALRWGAFLLVYAPLEAFFNEVLASEKNTRTIRLNVDTLRTRGLELHNVRLFEKDWSLRTRVPSGLGGRSRWNLYGSGTAIRPYLADMKSLRDLLSHGGNPYAASNSSSALWPVKDGWSMRLMGVEGFLQAACDLMDQTLVAYGGDWGMVPWPEPVRSGLSAEPKPPLLMAVG